MDTLKAYPCEATEAAFLLGGIGTGNISVGSRGNLQDFEIFNSPAKHNDLHNTFFALWAKPLGGVAVSRILESELRPPYSQSKGYSSGLEGGLPRFTSASLRGEYPFCQVEYRDNSLPVQVSLEAFTPFIPLNADDSGIPVAVLRYKVINTGKEPVDVTIAGSLANVSGFAGFDLFTNMHTEGVPVNEQRDEGDIRGIFFTNMTLQPHLLNYGNLALITCDQSVTVKSEWHTTGWFDGLQDFWEDFSQDGRIQNTPGYHGITGKGTAVGSLGICHTLMPGEGKDFEFFLSWYFPNRPRGWPEHMDKPDGLIEKNHYATRFRDAWDAGAYTARNLARLESTSQDFHRALFSSTLPPEVLEAVSCNITQLRSNTCFRIEDGTFLGWEGCHDTAGSCFGTCTHVWNYAQTVAFLFPELERSARTVELNLETDNQGFMAYRTNRVFGRPKFEVAAADGQMGVIIRTYREWKLSGDNAFLRSVWEKVALALEFAFSYWDTDGDLILDGEQHNTYDIELFGPNPLTGVLFCAALKAGTEMAAAMGDPVRALKFGNAFSISSPRLDTMLWNGEYYIQPLNDIDYRRYQFGTGCLSDQLLGQFMAHVAGLGYVMPEAHVKLALQAIFKYNFRQGMRGSAHAQRTYALNDERGLLMCSWPDGGRPKLPFVYSDEVWAGVEYQVAAHLIYEGLVTEGLELVRAVRERYDGYRRNPWNEVECGSHYARSMSSWALITALGGFTFDMTDAKTVGFNPKINVDNFSTFFSTGLCWGIYTQKKNINSEIERKIDILYGDKSVRLQ
jgi:non-lysosomal glucosylceramidase